MRKWMTRIWIGLMILLFLGCSIGILAGCQQPTPAEKDAKVAAVQDRAAKSPTAATAIWKIIDAVIVLTDDGLQALAEYGNKLVHRQDLQKSWRHWLILVAALTGLFALSATAGKFMANTPTWWGVILAWIAEQVNWKTIAVAGAICAACICGAIWIAPLWSFGVDALKFVALAVAFYAGWALSARAHTGPWKPDGLVRLPAGWSVAPKA